MVLKYIPLFFCIAIISARVIPTDQLSLLISTPTTVVRSLAPVIYDHPQATLKSHRYDRYDPHRQYKFSYEINDEHTGVNHSHKEARDGDYVQGEYSLIDADGFKRIVQYTVSPQSGFSAVVNRIPLVQHIMDKQYPSPAAYHQYH